MASDAPIRFLPLRYDAADADGSARRLVAALRPDWDAAAVEFVRFTDGITNTLLKAVQQRPRAGQTAAETAAEKAALDRDAILLRAYGPGTDVIIDRQREAQNHELLMRHGLAPELLARFANGMLYRFVRGSVTRPEDMRRPAVSCAIARRLAQWHAVVPCLQGPTTTTMTTTTTTTTMTTTTADHTAHADHDHDHDTPLPGTPALHPNLWTVMQKWIRALPAVDEAQRARRALLQHELAAMAAELGPRPPPLGDAALVFAHTDLLSGNVIVLPAEPIEPTDDAAAATPETTVTFIDYEYAVPSPAAFDIANHFAEWGGFDCDMAALPTVAQRRLFVDAYVRAYALFRPLPPADSLAAASARLMREIDLFRGLPGFYWGIWASIQATISDIDFDYASYADTRLAEYWAWKAERDGSRAAAAAEMPLRERRWAQESDGGGRL